MKTNQDNQLMMRHAEKVLIADFAREKCPQIISEITSRTLDPAKMLEALSEGGEQARTLVKQAWALGNKFALRNPIAELDTRCRNLAQGLRLQLSGRRAETPKVVEKLPLRSARLEVDWIESTAILDRQKFIDVRISAKLEKRPVGRPRKPDAISQAIADLNRTNPEFATWSLPSKYDAVRKYCGIEKYDRKSHKGFSSPSIYAALRKAGLSSHK